MNYFLDSNVIIGYIFQFDSQNEHSQKYVNSKHTCFISPNVEREVKGKFRIKNREYANFFLKLNQEICKQCKYMISNWKIHQIVNKFDAIGDLEVEKMHEIIEKIWEEFNFSDNEDCLNLMNILKEFLHEFKAPEYSLKNKILDKLTIIPEHNKKDRKILEIIEKKNLRELLHRKDENILFDLNEYAKEHPELDLCLVSWDDDFIEAVKILLNQLSFKKYIGRKLKSD